VPGFQPRITTDHVWYNGTDIHTYSLSTGLGIRVTEIRGWDERPDVRDVRENRSGQDGEYADNLYLGGRTISIVGAVHGSSWVNLQARKRELAALFMPQSDEVLFKVPDPATASPTAVYATTGMSGYERVSARVIEPITFGELIGSCAMTFQVVLRASDPRVYSDVATSTDSATTGTAPRTATVDQGGTHPTNPTLTVTGPTTSLWTVSEPTSRLNLSFSGLTLTSNESVELDVLERTATIIGPYQDLRTRRSECVALWRFNESAGTTADNYDGNATYDGTYTNGPTLNQTGPFTNVPSVVLDGTNDYITVSYNANLNPAAMTFEGWFYVNALPVGSSTAIASSGQTSEGWEVGLTTDGFLNLYIGNGTTFANWGTTSVTTATWHHLAVVVDASADTALMYIDGIKANEINPSVYSGGRNVTVNTARPLWWGRSNVGTQYLNGRVSAFALYNSAYSAQQVYDLYTSTGTASELSGYGYLVGNSARWAPLETSSSTYTLTGGSFGSGTKLNVTYRDARL
jgi:hypothetical protein